MAFGTGLIWVYSSTSGVVMPAFQPMVPDLAQQIGAVEHAQLAWHREWRARRSLSALSTVSAPYLAAATATRARRSTRSSRGALDVRGRRRALLDSSGSGWESRVSIVFAAPVQRLVRARPDGTSPAWPALYSGARVFVDRCRDANDKVFGRDAERLRRSSWPPGSSTTPHRLPVRHVRRRDCGGVPAAALRTCRTARRPGVVQHARQSRAKADGRGQPATLWRWSMAGDCGRKWYAVRHATCSRYAERCPLTTDRRHACTGCALSRSPASTAC